MAAYEIQKHFKGLRVAGGRRSHRVDPFATGFEDEIGEAKTRPSRPKTTSTATTTTTAASRTSPPKNKPPRSSRAGIDAFRDSDDDDFLNAPSTRTDRRPSPAPAFLPTTRVTDGAGRRGSVDHRLQAQQTSLLATAPTSSNLRPVRSAVEQAAGTLAYLDDSEDEEELPRTASANARYHSPAPRSRLATTATTADARRQSSPSKANPRETSQTRILPSRHTVASPFAGTKYLEDSSGDSDEEAVTSRTNSTDDTNYSSEGPNIPQQQQQQQKPVEAQAQQQQNPSAARPTGRARSGSNPGSSTVQNGGGVNWRAFSAGRAEQRNNEIEAVAASFRSRGRTISFCPLAVTDDGRSIPLSAASETSTAASSAAAARRGRGGLSSAGGGGGAGGTARSGRQGRPRSPPRPRSTSDPLRGTVLEDEDDDDEEGGEGPAGRGKSGAHVGIYDPARYKTSPFTAASCHHAHIFPAYFLTINFYTALIPYPPADMSHPQANQSEEAAANPMASERAGSAGFDASSLITSPTSPEHASPSSPAHISPPTSDHDPDSPSHPDRNSAMTDSIGSITSMTMVSPPATIPEGQYVSHAETPPSVALPSPARGGSISRNASARSLLSGSTTAASSTTSTSRPMRIPPTRRSSRRSTSGTTSISPAHAFLSTWSSNSNNNANNATEPAPEPQPDDEGQAIGVNGEYILGREISRGGFGVVREIHSLGSSGTPTQDNRGSGMLSSTPQTSGPQSGDAGDQQHRSSVLRRHAVKIVRKVLPGRDETENERCQQELEHEISVWRHLKHRHVLDLIAVFDAEFATFCVMQLNVGGTLFDLVRRSRAAANKRSSAGSSGGDDGLSSSQVLQQQSQQQQQQQRTSRGLPPLLARSYAAQLASALRYLHQDIKVCHRDIKLENCLVDMTTIDPSTGAGNLRLCDFGLADFLHSAGSDGDQNAEDQDFDDGSTTYGGSNYNGREGDVAGCTDMHDGNDGSRADGESMFGLSTPSTPMPVPKPIPVHASHPPSVPPSTSAMAMAMRGGSEGVENMSLAFGSTGSLSSLGDVGASSLSSHSASALSPASLSRSGSGYFASRYRSYQTLNQQGQAQGQQQGQQRQTQQNTQQSNQHQHQQQQHGQKAASSIIGTLEYASPRGLSVHRKLYETAGDVWALGVVVYALCTGDLPFRHPMPAKTVELIMGGEWDESALLASLPAFVPGSSGVNNSGEAGASASAGAGAGVGVEAGRDENGRDNGNNTADSSGSASASGSAPANAAAPLLELLRGCLERNVDLRWTIADVVSCAWFEGLEDEGDDGFQDRRMM